jgi:hypothetical protein
MIIISQQPISLVMLALTMTEPGILSRIPTEVKPHYARHNTLRTLFAEDGSFQSPHPTPTTDTHTGCLTPHTH